MTSKFFFSKYHLYFIKFCSHIMTPMVSFPRFGLNVTSTVVKETTKRGIRRGEEGKAEEERGCRDTQPHLQLLAWLSV